MLEPTIYYTQSKHAYYYTTDARTHDLLHSKSARLLLHHRCSNPRSTTLKVSTLTITPSMLEPTIYYTQSKHAYYYTIDARTHDQLHSKSARLLLHHRCSNPRSTTLSQHGYYYTIDARTHDQLHSKSARLLLHHRCSNPRSTTLKVSTVTIRPSMLEPTIYYTQSQHSYYYTIDARTHDLLHSKSARLLLHHRCSNPRSTTLKVSTLTITPPMRYSTMCINFFKVRFMFSISLKASSHLSSCIKSVFLANSFCQNKTYKKGKGYEYDGYVFVAWVL